MCVCKLYFSDLFIDMKSSMNNWWRYALDGCGLDMNIYIVNEFGNLLHFVLEKERVVIV